MKPTTVGAVQIENAEVDDDGVPLVEKGRSKVAAPQKLVAPRLKGTMSYIMTTPLIYLLVPVITCIIIMPVVIYVFIPIEFNLPIEASVYVMGYVMCYAFGHLVVLQGGIVVRSSFDDLAWPLLRYQALVGAFTGALDCLWYNSVDSLLFGYGWHSLGDLMIRAVVAATLDSVFWLALDLMTHFADGWYFVNGSAGFLDAERFYIFGLWNKVAGFPLLLSLWVVLSDFEGWYARPIIVMVWTFINQLMVADFESYQSIQGGDVLLSHCIDAPVGVIPRGANVRWSCRSTIALRPGRPQDGGAGSGSGPGRGAHPLVGA